MDSVSRRARAYWRRGNGFEGVGQGCVGARRMDEQQIIWKRCDVVLCLTLAGEECGVVLLHIFPFNASFRYRHKLIITFAHSSRRLSLFSMMFIDGAPWKRVYIGNEHP